MRNFVIAADPGNNCGIVYGFIDEKPTETLHDFTPKSGTKKRLAEEKHLRYGKLWNVLHGIEREWGGEVKITIICEGAAGFTKGKSAVEVSNKYRGVVEAFCAVNGIDYIGIQPSDLQRWATGKGRSEKSEMMKVAADRYGFTGTNDNVADALLMWYFAKEQITLNRLAHEAKI